VRTSASPISSFSRLKAIDWHRILEFLFEYLVCDVTSIPRTNVELLSEIVRLLRLLGSRVVAENPRRLRSVAEELRAAANKLPVTEHAILFHLAVELVDSIEYWGSVMGYQMYACCCVFTERDMSVHCGGMLAVDLWLFYFLCCLDLGTRQSLFKDGQPLCVSV